MGEEAWRTLGKIAQLPAWNDALATLGDRYVPIENTRVGEQTRAHLEEARPLLRALARHVAVEAGDPELFHRIEEVSQNLEADVDWSTQWWEVPFGSVLDACAPAMQRYRESDATWKSSRAAKTTDNLRAAFQRHGVEIDPDPYETASQNQERLRDMLVQLHDAHRTWVEFRASAATRPLPPAQLVCLEHRVPGVSGRSPSCSRRRSRQLKTMNSSLPAPDV